MKTFRQRALNKIDSSELQAGRKLLEQAVVMWCDLSRRINRQRRGVDERLMYSEALIKATALHEVSCSSCRSDEDAEAWRL